MEERPGKRVDGWSKKIYTKNKSTSKNEWATKKPTVLEGETRAPEMFSGSRCRSHCYRPAGISSVIANVLELIRSVLQVMGSTFINHVISHFNGGFQHYVSPETNHASRIRRFGFTQLNELRQHFCHSFCKSADTMPYLLNLLCAAKCPELYLPHHTTQSKYNGKYNSGKYIYTNRNYVIELSDSVRNDGPIRASFEHNTPVRIEYKWNVSERSKFEYNTLVRIEYKWNVSNRNKFEYNNCYKWNALERNKFEHRTPIRTRYRTLNFSLSYPSSYPSPILMKFKKIMNKMLELIRSVLQVMGSTFINLGLVQSELDYSGWIKTRSEYARACGPSTMINDIQNM
ncbi:hypothetical protein G5I_02961 [Acromyrmex echinatior]|uniref:Uncharacterized protein n=1 Tax=Acromyrmex echinatior TaxID=103372 RepID=F4WBP2_ACREC|nr:hypothetical protein G5I_02961 [Acromyrmex echinatior]